MASPPASTPELVGRQTIDQMAEAQAVCDSCPVVDGCLEHAVVWSEFGFWGGTTERQRKAIRRRRRLAGTYPLPKEDVDQSWREHAACRGVDPDVFLGTPKQPTRAEVLAFHLAKAS